MIRPFPRGSRAALALAAGLVTALIAGPAAAQTSVQVGSTNETARESEWMLGVGYDFDFPALPISVGVLGQTGVSRSERFPLPVPAADEGEPETRRSFPARAFGVVKVGLLPAPGFRLYLGLGGGLATRFRALSERTTNPAGIALAGFSAGRLSLEAQYQREFAETPVNRWAYLLGVSF